MVQRVGRSDTQTVSVFSQDPKKSASRKTHTSAHKGQQTWRNSESSGARASSYPRKTRREIPVSHLKPFVKGDTELESSGKVLLRKVYRFLPSMSKIGLYKNTQESPIKIIHIEYLWIPCIKENPHMYAKCMVNELPLIWILQPKILEGLTNLRSSHSLAKPEAISGFHETPGMYTWTMEIGTTADCSVFHDSFHRFEIGRSCLTGTCSFQFICHGLLEWGWTRSCSNLRRHASAKKVRCLLVPCNQVDWT